MHQQKKGKRLIPIKMTSGQIAYIDPSKIPGQDWKTYSGQASDGTQVNSLVATEVGKSTVLGYKGGAVLSTETTEIEVFSVKFLQERGFEIKAPAGVRRAA